MVPGLFHACVCLLNYSTTMIYMWPPHATAKPISSAQWYLSCLFLPQLMCRAPEPHTNRWNKWYLLSSLVAKQSCSPLFLSLLHLQRNHEVHYATGGRDAVLEFQKRSDVDGVNVQTDVSLFYTIDISFAMTVSHLCLLLLIRITHLLIILLCQAKR